ncbi:hypothetical protein BCR42DRAFT_373164 [Absidia repens]|uniref:Tryptophan-rich sensory protein n=1 Tax=Absidia repens TaxID=90262 RepID=A0A1X2IJQ1_9FUNG|nr:hypothetical protein BCR42DRAFT_373164 [Absidia repens]
MSHEHTIQKAINVLVYAFLITATVLSFSGNDNLADIFSSFETYFDPAPWVFTVWTLIYLLLGGFVIYQWFDQAHESALHGVGWHFILSAILNTLWFSLLEGEHKVLSFFISVLQVFSISFVFYKLEAEFPANNWWDRLFLHAPFSLWHGWSVFIAVVTAFVTFTGVKKTEDGTILPPNVLHIVLFYIGLAFLSLTAIGYVEYKGQKGDLTSAWVISFGLWAIFVEQPFVTTHWGALAAAIITTLWPAKPYILRALGRSTTSENAPLLG